MNLTDMTEDQLADWLFENEDEHDEYSIYHVVSQCEICVAQRQYNLLRALREAQLPGENPHGGRSSTYKSIPVTELRRGDVLTFSLPGTNDWASFYVQVTSVTTVSGRLYVAVRKTNTTETPIEYVYEANDTVNVSRLGLRN